MSMSSESDAFAVKYPALPYEKLNPIVIQDYHALVRRLR